MLTKTVLDVTEEFKGSSTKRREELLILALAKQRNHNFDTDMEAIACAMGYKSYNGAFILPSFKMGDAVINTEHNILIKASTKESLSENEIKFLYILYLNKSSYVPIEQLSMTLFGDLKSTHTVEFYISKLQNALWGYATIQIMEGSIHRKKSVRYK